MRRYLSLHFGPLDKAFADFMAETGILADGARRQTQQCYHTQSRAQLLIGCGVPLPAPAHPHLYLIVTPDPPTAALDFPKKCGDFVLDWAAKTGMQVCVRLRK